MNSLLAEEVDQLKPLPRIEIDQMGLVIPATRLVEPCRKAVVVGGPQLKLAIVEPLN